MSGPSGSSGSGRPVVNGAMASAPISGQHTAGVTGSGGGGAASASQSNLNGIVIEYLSKKGYSKTEAMLRMESANQDVDPNSVINRPEKPDPVRFTQAFGLFIDWIEGALEVYKADLRRLLWPVFVYSFLQIVHHGYSQKDTKDFFDRYRTHFEQEHADDIRALSAISLPGHLEDNPTAQVYLSNKYRVSLVQMAFNTMIQFLESETKKGGDLLVAIIHKHLDVVTVDRTTDDQTAFARLLSRAKLGEDFPKEDEGIPGHSAGSPNIGREAGSSVLSRVKLGQMPMEKDLKDDVLATLEEEDAKAPPEPGQESLVQTFEKRIKMEEEEGDGPSRTELPLPPSTARDVAIEVQKVKDERSAFKMQGRTGGIGTGVSIAMYTFHNTNDAINCFDISDDLKYIAAGTSDSYARVFTLDGSPTTSALDFSDRQPTASRRLIGHSGGIYGIAFSPGAQHKRTESNIVKPRFILTSSGDKTIRLWSMETWQCLTIYRGHEQVVWDVAWNPLGSYFVSGSLDKTCRMWRNDQATWARMFAGHEKDVSVVTWHTNGVYIFTASDDKTVRMWQMSTGLCTRMYTGHTGNITSLTVSPNGKLVASADDQGIIILWDLPSGRLKKRMRGHARGGGIWSLSFSMESTILVSGGADCTVRVWDVDLPTDPAAVAGGAKAGNAESSAAGQKADVAGGAQANVAGKKKGKDVQVTPDQISAFPTKKTPVYKVYFTRQNLIVAAGPFVA